VATNLPNNIECNSSKLTTKSRSFDSILNTIAVASTTSLANTAFTMTARDSVEAKARRLRAINVSTCTYCALRVSLTHARHSASASPVSKRTRTASLSANFNCNKCFTPMRHRAEPTSSAGAPKARTFIIVRILSDAAKSHNYWRFQSSVANDALGAVVLSCHSLIVPSREPLTISASLGWQSTDTTAPVCPCSTCAVLRVCKSMM
jgi:hypothetical protein